MSLDDAAQACLTVARALEKLGLAYVVGGSFASSVHGVPRSTNDVDFVVRFPARVAGAFAKELGPDFYVDTEMILDACRHHGTFNVIHMPTMFKVDVFVGTADPLIQEELARGRLHRLSPGSPEQVMFCSAEDILLQKLNWFRQGGRVSERQWKDVLGIIRQRGSSLDREYLSRWAPHLGVADDLQRALAGESQAE